MICNFLWKMICVFATLNLFIEIRAQQDIVYETKWSAKTGPQKNAEI